MSNSDYTKIRNSIITAVVASIVISFGSVFTNHLNTKFQVNENSKKIELKADKSEIESYKEIARIKEERFNEINQDLKEDVKDLTNDIKEVKEIIPFIKALKDELIPDYKNELLTDND